MVTMHWAGLAPVVILAAALAGCSSLPTPNAGAGDGLDKPVAAGLNVPAGSNEDFIVNVGRRIFFADNSAELDVAAKDTLDKQAAFLTDYKGYKVKIEGFADEPGGAPANMALSLKRAQAAQAYLLAQGIPANRMRIKGFGATRPVRACDEAGCKAPNRRVVTVLDIENGA